MTEGSSCARAAARGLWRSSWVAMMAVALGVGCASRSLPPLSSVAEPSTQFVKPGKFVWVDLATDDVGGALQFYGALFNWTFEKDGTYTKVLADGVPIAGIVEVERPVDGARASEWVSNLSVADVDSAISILTEKGGEVERGPVDAPLRGRIALVRDPGGAMLLLLRSSNGDPADGEPVPGRWLWRELWTHDVDAAVSFYADLAGYAPETIEFDGTPYHVLIRDGVPRAGVMKLSEDADPLWLPYVRVMNAGVIAERARELGARVVMQDTDAAIMIDPTGALFGVQVWVGTGEGELQ